VRRYASELFAALSRRDDVAVVAVGASEEAAVPPGVVAAAAGMALPTNLGWSNTGLPLGARNVKADVFHAPAYTAPLWGCRPLVVSIHDVSYARRPEWYPNRLDSLRLAFYARSARRADRVVACSRFSRNEILAAYELDPARIDVVPLAAGSAFSPAPGRPRELFVLHVGDLHPRRNLTMLFEVIADLRRSESSLGSVKLVLAGVDRGELGPLRDLAQRLGAVDALEYVGVPGDDDLAELYRRASLFAYPSRYEGFGLPVLEAMSSGCPVVSSSAASLPEVTGSSAILVGPEDARAWREAIRHVLCDSGQACELSRAGLQRAAMFTWDRTADATLASYRRAVRAS
jgi:glycosyltransferase involved in cell wall biosynthesis